MLPPTLIDAILKDDEADLAALLKASPELATATLTEGERFIPEIRQQIYTGDTALHIAASGGRTKVAKLLIEAGADPGAKNRRGTESLHLAATRFPATIVFLIEAGANPNAQNKDGATPLHRAVRSRCAEAVKMLLAHGADRTIRNKNGSTPAETAAHTTGREGTGSHEAKAEQQKILQLLQTASRM